MANDNYDVEIRQCTVRFSDKNKHIVTKLMCQETLSSCYSLSFSVAAVSEIKHNNLGNPVFIHMKHPIEEKFFSAICSSISFTGANQDKGLFYYQIEAVDPFSLLSFTKNSRLFQNMTTQEMVETMLKNAKLDRYITFSVANKGEKKALKVQYNESDLHFIQRLLSEEGWHYHCRVKDDCPSMIISDNNQQFKRATDPNLFYQSEHKHSEKSLATWQSNFNIQPHSVCLRDVLANNDTIITENQTTDSKSNSLRLEHYQFSTGDKNKAQLRHSAECLSDAFSASQDSYSSSSLLTQLSCGVRFTLNQHPLTEFNQEYVITSITHQLVFDEGKGNAPLYKNEFLCIPLTYTLRPQRIDKPIIHHLHTGTVTGPDNETIYTDKYGRVKVRFHWDRNDIQNENASTWLPVSQLFAGEERGFRFIPRIGDQVLIQYINGDPDQPIVMGAVHSEKHPIPFSTETESGIQSQTIPKQAGKKSNALLFDDKTDKQRLSLYAARDFSIDVEHDAQIKILNQYSLDVAKETQKTYQADVSLNYEQNYQSKSKGTMTFHIDKDLIANASQSLSLCGEQSVSIDGRSALIEGKQEIKLKVGPCSIHLSPTGIAINAPKISINSSTKTEISGGMVNISAQGQAIVSGTLTKLSGSAMTEVKAGAMVQIQGAITKVN